MLEQCQARVVSLARRPPTLDIRHSAIVATSVFSATTRPWRETPQQQ